MKFIDIFNKYKEVTTKATIILFNHSNGLHPLEAWHKNIILKSDFIKDKCFQYDFHGIGCQGKLESIFFDFDFIGENISFDEWSFKLFIEYNNFPNFNVNAELNKLLNKDIVEQNKSDIGRKYTLKISTSYNSD